jgi:hypothetical protein
MDDNTIVVDIFKLLCKSKKKKKKRGVPPQFSPQTPAKRPFGERAYPRQGYFILGSTPECTSPYNCLRNYGQSLKVIIQDFMERD